MRASQVVKCQSLFIGIAILFLSSAFLLQCCLIWDALIQALPRQNAEFNLCQYLFSVQLKASSSSLDKVASWWHNHPRCDQDVCLFGRCPGGPS